MDCDRQAGVSAQTHGVMRASPVGHRTPRSTSSTSRHASYRSRPAALWMAPSTPPPPSMRSFAAAMMTRANRISKVDAQRRWLRHSMGLASGGAGRRVWHEARSSTSVDDGVAIKAGQVSPCELQCSSLAQLVLHRSCSGHRHVRCPNPPAWFQGRGEAPRQRGEVTTSQQHALDDRRLPLQEHRAGRGSQRCRRRAFDSMII